ncbi:hypothetical protein CMI37_01140 [Candidatus Pacearchaeota archaeon]|nr:hypothetical protein [Candidatus Pacearchaeota archaeon]|tara:strand:+ start:5762 stop:6016 length:255 start_codon:yes stop_codon:yes gene_type:complete
MPWYGYVIIGLTGLLQLLMVSFLSWMAKEVLRLKPMVARIDADLAVIKEACSRRIHIRNKDLELITAIKEDVAYIKGKLSQEDN